MRRAWRSGRPFVSMPALVWGNAEAALRRFFLSAFPEQGLQAPGSGPRSRPIVKILISVLSAVVLTLSGAAAEKHEQPDKPEPLRGYIPIQLPSVSVPVVTRDGWLARGTISMFMVVRGQKNVETFCRYRPRVREAITVTVDKDPIPILKKKFQFENIGTLLHQAINEILPKPLVIRLHLLPIARLVGQGGVNLELPGTGSKCMALKKLPEEVLAMFEGENPEAKTFSVPDPEPKPRAEPRAEPRPELSKPAVRIIPQLLPPRSVPSRSASTPSKTSKIDVPAWESKAMGKKFQDPEKCQNLSKVWASGFHKAGGRTYWLGRAFTLDDDSDGAVDNVGFILKAEDRPDLYIYYFPGQGRQSVVTVPTLRLKDDRDVSAICFGQEEFKKPKEKIEAPEKPFKVPDLAAELAAKGEKAKDGFQAAGEPEKKAPGKPFLGGLGLVFAIAAAAGFVLILGAGAGYVIARRRLERRRKGRRGRHDRRRGPDRREREKPPEGDDRRKGEDRRSDAKRRTEEDRRMQGDRRQ